MTSEIYQCFEGDQPLIISMPHNGTMLPPTIAAEMHEAALSVPDTDWYMDRLYAFCKPLGITLLMPYYSRYVIDLNRDINNLKLYPGQNETELCPTTQFDLAPIYRPGLAPGPEEVQARINAYWQPYHQQLKRLVNHNIERHGISLVLDAHSIRSEVPRFFDGVLPHLNIGTNDGLSCAPGLQQQLAKLDSGHFQCVVNGRFKGGYITRHYGRPLVGQHAVQLEIAQRAYLDAGSEGFNPDFAKPLIAYLQTFVKVMLSWLDSKKHH